jgi:transporter family-2 protein
MNPAAVPLALSILAGLLIAIQPPTNAMLARASGSPVVAAFLSLLVSTISVGVLVAANPGRLFAPQLRALPWYAWLGGIYGAFFVVVLAFAAPRIGVATLFTALILGQLSAALFLDHHGMFELSPQPVSVQRLVGVALVVLGAVLVRRG